VLVVLRGGLVGCGIWVAHVGFAPVKHRIVDAAVRRRCRRCGYRARR
jgi:hypothetical protein